MAKTETDMIHPRILELSPNDIHHEALYSTVSIHETLSDQKVSTRRISSIPNSIMMKHITKISQRMSGVARHRDCLVSQGHLAEEQQLDALYVTGAGALRCSSGKQITYLDEAAHLPCCSE